MRSLLVFAALGAAFPAAAQPAAPAPEAQDAVPYARLADTVLGARVIATGTVRGVSRLGRSQSVGVAPGRVRTLVTADLGEVIVAPGEMPARVEFLWDGLADARGRPVLAKGTPVLLLGDTVEGRPGQLRLLGPDGLQPAAGEARVRTMLTEARLPGRAALRVTGVRDALFSAGTVAGESESQFFLENSGDPLTLVVSRAAGAEPRVRLATGELIDDSAAPVQPRTLLWRALACGLPEALPPRLAADAGLSADYATVRASLGPCVR